MAGKIVMVDRGLCTFEEKAAMATQMGAAALIIGNRDDAPIGMSGSDTTLVTTVSIGLADRESIRSTIVAGSPVTVTIKDATTATKSDSYRWLLSEKSTAFGGAIRDMWNPTCHGDPGKVSDAEYKCSSDDSGGVHGNSGVPNHGYALLVDGGTFNGQTVEGLGFDKAANIYFYAQNYMGPTSDFVDHADSLEQACADLIGQDIKKLSFAEGASPGSAAPITAADCTQVAKVTAAVELRLDPTEKCKWKPLLDPPPRRRSAVRAPPAASSSRTTSTPAWTPGPRPRTSSTRVASPTRGRRRRSSPAGTMSGASPTPLPPTRVPAPSLLGTTPAMTPSRAPRSSCRPVRHRASRSTTTSPPRASTTAGT